MLVVSFAISDGRYSTVRVVLYDRVLVIHSWDAYAYMHTCTLRWQLSYYRWHLRVPVLLTRVGVSFSLADGGGVCPGIGLWKEAESLAA